MTSVALFFTADSRSREKGDSAEVPGRLSAALCWDRAEDARDCHPFGGWSATIGRIHD